MNNPSTSGIFLRDEEDLLAVEEAATGPCAQLSSWARRRYEMEFEGRQYSLRIAYQHDRDRIVHSRAFRRLKHKTQVFIPYRSDHQRTRLTHTVEVMQIGRTIARCLGLNEDLTEAIALGHDLGHTPFGHIGERTLDRIMRGGGGERLEKVPQELAKKAGGFKHNLQSLRVADLLETRYEHPGLNLSDRTREGILKHTAWKKWTGYPGLEAEGLNLERPAPHFEGQVVAVADEITQQAHDLEDGIRARFVDLKSMEELELIKRIKSRNTALQRSKIDRFTKQNIIIRSLIHTLVTDVIMESAGKLSRWCRRHGIENHQQFLEKQDEITVCVGFSKELKPLFRELKSFVVGKVIRSKSVKLTDEHGKYLIQELFNVFYDDPLLLPGYVLGPYSGRMKIERLDFVGKRWTKKEVEAEVGRHYKGRVEFLRLICDFIAGMSNTFALDEYQKWCR